MWFQSATEDLQPDPMTEPVPAASARPVRVRVTPTRVAWAILLAAALMATALLFGADQLRAPALIGLWLVAGASAGFAQSGSP